VYTIVIAYEIESAGLYAMQTAIQLALALAEAKLFDLEIALQHLRSVKARYGLDLAPNPSLLRRLSAVFLTEVWKMVL
jgi:hypothetical protein